MKMTASRRLYLPFLALAIVSPICANAHGSSAQSAKNVENWTSRDDDRWSWKWSENGRSLEMTIRGKVEFNDDYTEILSISPGGSFYVKDGRGSAARTLQIVPSGSGLVTTYTVQGQTRQFDADARAWFASLLSEAVRQSGLDAKPRAQRILRQRGLDALLDEVSSLRSDYVKRIYLQEAIANGNLDSSAVRRVLDLAARNLSSDYEKAQTLTKVAESLLADEQSRAAYLEAVRTIKSDYERRRAISALLKQDDLSRDNLLVVLKSAADISSDYEKATLLMKVAERNLDDDELRATYLDTVATIRSDYERARVLTAILKKENLRKDTLMLALKSAAGINSDYEKARVLIRVAEASSGDEAVRAALIDTARTIRSDYERGRVLNAVFKR
jgi:hypothetical protein